MSDDLDDYENLKKPDEIYEASGQFTDAYKFYLMIHPVLKNLTEVVINAETGEEKPALEITLRKFLNNLELSAQAFLEFSSKAYDHIQLVQDGFYLITCMLHQFYPDLDEQQSVDYTYALINKIFWGKYFYKNGVVLASNSTEGREINVWKSAKRFALEHWRFGKEHFPEAIGWGYQWLLEHEPQAKLDFQKIPELLKRFQYEDAAILGFCYFLGLCAQAGKQGEKEPEIFERLKRLPDVDINGEYEALLGPLRTAIMDNTFDELVWRFNGEIEGRKIELEQLREPIYVYNFKNNGMIFDDDRKVKTLKDAEDFFKAAMTVMGQELKSKEYTFVQSFKAGVCSANLRAQSDQMATYRAGSMFDSRLPMIFGAANRYTVDASLDWSGYLDVQIPLQVFLFGTHSKLGKIIWSFQSLVLFENGEVRSGTEDLSIYDFMSHCRESLLEFYSRFPEACDDAALARNHWSTFPALSGNYDERPIILDVIKESLGYDRTMISKADKQTLKALIIFGYFCALCETVLAKVDGQNIH